VPVLAASTAIVDWNAMWKIFLVVLLAGTGTVIVFGFLLLGLKFANRLGTDDTEVGGSEGARVGGYVLAAVCGVIVIAVVGIGVYAMTKKPSSKPAKPKAALVIRAGAQVKVIASLR
jgi:heme/copper-type cytochrome/quinol oxidase subunit 2